jgi:hypothetical protein
MTDPFAPPSGDPNPPPVYGTPPPPPPYGAPPTFAPPQYGAPQYGGPVSGPPRNGFGVAALVLGILGLVSFFTIFGGIVLGILGLIFGILGRKRAKRNEATNGGMALAGAICGGIGLVGAIAYLILIVAVLNSDSGKKLRDCLADAGTDQQARTLCSQEFQNDITN